jgi:hypothetical protein
MLALVRHHFIQHQQWTKSNAALMRMFCCCQAPIRSPLQMQMVVLVPSQISLLLRRLKQVDGVAELRCDTTGAAIAVSITGGTQTLLIR